MADGRASRIDAVAATGATLALVAVAFMPFVVLKPNRLAPGDALGIEAAGLWAWLVGAAFVICLVGVFVPRHRGFTLLVGSSALATCLAFAQGAATVSLLAGEPAAARVSTGSGGWLALAGVFAIVLAGRDAWEGPRWLRSALTLAPVVGILAAIPFGGLDQSALARELSIRTDRFRTQAIEHVFLTAAGLGLGLLIGLPLGVWATRNKRVRDTTLYTTSIIQTIPSLAILGLLIAPLAALGAAYPLLAELGIRGIGVTPAIIALTLYALLPIVRNTYTGLIEVDPGAIDAGLGMGMSRRQLLARVELPLALPLIFEGVRLAAVLLVGITALTALNGAGGLGFFIFEGLNQAAPDLILLGALPTIALAVVLDVVLRLIARAAVPEGVRHA